MILIYVFLHKNKGGKNMNENENLNNDAELKEDTINDEDDELETNIVTLKDELGNDVNFEFLDLIEYEGEDYVILLPAEPSDEEESDEVVILKEDKESEDSEEESYISVDDEETLNKVFEIFKEKFKDEFNFVDDEQ